MGNQLFQYAAGRRLALHHRTSLKLDIRDFQRYTWHAYSLKPFGFRQEFATSEEIEPLKNGRQNGVRRFVSAVRRGRNPFRPTVLSETTVHPYHPEFLHTGKDIYLDGYWQSEKYFADIAELIRTEFRITVEQDQRSQEVAAAIRAAQSVSVHVRRGNYVSIPEVNAVHGTCGVEYYDKAVAEIARRVDSPHFFVFSDDPSWAKENLRFGHPTTVVDHNDASRDYEDFRLLSLCKHHIIANSTFSWWGAWLSENTDKIVIAPRRWLSDPNVDVSDVVPSRWMKI